jgi:SAM-dependent methyltransferase
MDLCEIQSANSKRHPWELARLQTLRHILQSYIIEQLNIEPSSLRMLDVGCGDGYTAQELAADFGIKDLVGLDLYLTPQNISDLKQHYPHTLYTNDPNHLEGRRFQLMLFLDVLEHIANDRRFLQEHIERFLDQHGLALITVPAFQCLFNQHDRYLKHYRRYTLSELISVVQQAGLKPLQRGYLFGSLLPIRMISTMLQKVLPFAFHTAQGIGQWQGIEIITQSIKNMLYIDNRCLLFLSQKQIYLPGLTSWVLCQK